jgi:hypothetical protein
MFEYLRWLWEKWRERRLTAARDAVVTLQDRLDSTDYLLNYIARKKIDIKIAEIVPKLARLRAALAEGRQPTETELTDFWWAYDVLVRTASPVTADSIKASGSYVRRANGEIARGNAGQAYWVAALIVLVAVVVTQIYWLVGTNLIGGIDSLEEEIASSTMIYAANNHLGGNMVATLFGGYVMPSGAPPVTAGNGHGLPTVSDGTAGPSPQAVQQNAVAQSAQGGSPQACLGTAQKIDTSTVESRTVFDLLANAAVDLEQRCIFIHLRWRWLGYEELALWDKSMFGHSFIWPGLKDQNKLALDMTEYDLGLRNKELQPVMLAMETTHLLQAQNARFKVALLNKYILPMLYGLLGACTYVLRSLSVQVGAEIYSGNSHIGFRVRIILGAIVGLTAAWLFDFIGDNEQARSALGSLSPLALAFIAGYSVELLFTGMDRIIGAFTGSAGKGDAKA